MTRLGNWAVSPTGCLDEESLWHLAMLSSSKHSQEALWCLSGTATSATSSSLSQGQRALMSNKRHQVDASLQFLPLKS